MPELPDVEVFRRRLDAVGLPAEVHRVRVLDDSLLRDLSRQRLAKALNGQALTATRRHGKHLLVAVKGDGMLVLHFGMTGSLLHQTADAERPAHTRVELWLADGSVLRFVDQRKLGHLALTDDLDSYVAEHDLGPDALQLSRAELTELLHARRGGVKSALMDQAAIAGIGNIYSDEILFQARVHPKADAAGMDDRTCGRVHRQLRRVLQLAVEREADPTRLPRTWLLPHREDGAPCPRGEGTVRKMQLGGRGVFYCPTCQPRP